MPIMVVAYEDSSLGPIVSFPHSVKEQCHPARAATAFFVFSENSSRLCILLCISLAIGVQICRMQRLIRPAGQNRDLTTSDMSMPLGPAQLKRIESVHQGFLYQHLYAVSFLLTSARLTGNSLTVERDEDVEFSTQQQKTTSRSKRGRGHFSKGTSRAPFKILKRFDLSI
jgi:hypothetical protein